MSTSAHDPYLNGKLLIATPQLAESCFEQAVIYVCAHSDQGAMGVIVNQQVESIDDSELLEHLGIDKGFLARPLPIHFGGPVDPARGFILYGTEAATEDDATLVNGEFALSADIGLLKQIASGAGPRERMLTLGYAGWGPGQLETEIQQGSWLIVPATRELVFSHDNTTKWKLAAFSQGIDLARLSSTVGHA